MKKNFTRHFLNSVKGILLFGFAILTTCLTFLHSYGQIVITNPTSPWTVPAGVTSITVQCWGGGGGGGGNNGTGRSGSGGGGGAYTTSVVSVTPLTNYYLGIGTAGTIGTNPATPGGTGGMSWFNSSNTSTSALVLAVGGGGGTSATNTPGTGGLASACTPTASAFSGGNGGPNGSAGGNKGGGSGGSSAGTGTNGVAGLQNNTTATMGATAPTGGGNGGNSGYTVTLPTPGIAPGGGGGGSSNGTQNGAAGGLGQVIITYYPPTITSFSPNPVCIGGTFSVSGSNFTAGGTITFNGAPPVAYTYISPSSVTVTVPAGSATGTFSLTASGGIVTSSTPVTINALPATPTFLTQPTPPICPNTAGQIYSVNNLGLTYTWLVTGIGWGTFTGQSTSSISATSGTGTGTISVTGYDGNCTSLPLTTTTSIVAIPTQPTSITPVTAVCTGSTQTYTANGATGASYYTWTVPAGWTITSTPPYTNIITVTVGTATGTITATPYNTCNVAGTAQMLVNPTVTPVTMITTQPASPAAFCAGGNASFTVAATGAALTYQWYVSTNGGTTYAAVANGGVYAGATTVTLTLTAVPATMNGYLYECIVTGTCSAPTSNAATLSVNAVPATPTFASQPTPPVCPNTAGQVYSVNNLGLTYTWIVTGTGWGTFTGQGTSSISATSGTATGTISVTGSNGSCSSTALTTTTSILAAPTQPTSITPATAVCAGSTQTYTANGGTGASYYTWTVPAGWTITSVPPYTNVITVTVGTATGTITATPYNTCNNAGTAQTLVNPTITPATIITTQPSSPAAFCAGGNTSFTVAATGVTLTYQWQVSTNGGASYGAVANGGVYAGATTVTLTLTAVPATMNGYLYRCIVTGTCGAVTSNAATLTVNALPATPTFALQPTPPVCPNTAGQVYSVNNLGLTYTWIVTGTGWGTFTGQSTPSISATSGTGTGTISVTGSNGTCISAALTTTTTITTAPTQPTSITPATAVCAFSTQTYTANGATGASYYTWSVPAGWTITSTPPYTNAITVIVGTTTGTITATPYNTCNNPGTAQTLVNPTINPSTVTISTPIPATGLILAGNTNLTVFGFTLMPNACATSYNFTGANITTAGTATNTDLSNFQLYYDANNNGILDGPDMLVSTAALNLPGPLNFTVTGQTLLTGTRNYIVVATVANGAIAGRTFTGSFAASGFTVTGATAAGTATGNTQTIEGTVTITAVQPAAAFLNQSTTNNLVACYQITVNNGNSIKPGTLTFTTGGTYTSGTDFTNIKLWQNTTNNLSGTPTLLQTIISPIASGGNVVFNTGFTALALSSTTYFIITTDVAASGINGDNVNILADALTNFTFTSTVVRNGTNPTTVSNAQTIQGTVVTITQAHPAAGNIVQNTNSNPIAAYQISVANFPATPTSFVFTTGGTYNNGTDITTLSLYQNTTNSITGWTLIQSVTAPNSGGNVTFNTGFSSLPVGTVYFIVTANVGLCAVNGDTILINAGTTNFANFNFGSSVQKTGPVNPVPSGNAQVIVAPMVTLTTTHPAASNLTQGSTNNIIASYYMTASNFNVTPTSFTFTTGGVYTPSTDFTNFQLWVNSTKDSINGATLIGNIGTDPSTGTAITFSSFPGAATIPVGTGSYFFITVDVPLSAISGDYVYIARDNVSNFLFIGSNGGCVTKSPSSGNLPISNNQGIFGPSVVIGNAHPAAGNIVQGSTNNIIAVYSITPSNAVFVTPTNLTLTTAGDYVPGDLVNFKVYENTNATLLGSPTLVQTVTAIPASGGTVTFNSAFTAIGSAITTYLIVTADVTSAAIIGDTLKFTSTGFANFSFISSTGSGVEKNGGNPAATSKWQTIAGPQVSIATDHNPTGNMLRGSQNQLLAIYSITATNAAITPTSATFVTTGTYTGTNDIQDFNLYQNTSPSLTGATLVGTVLATGATSGQTIVFNSGFTSITSISPNNVNYFILVADIAGSATPNDYIAISGIAVPSSNFSFTSSGPVVITTTTPLAASNNQTILNALSVYWSNTTNPESWDNVTNNWAQVTGGPYTTSVWLENGYGFFEGTAGQISIVSPAANIVADSLTSNVNNYQIDASSSSNGITMVSPASFTVNTGTTYVGLNNTSNPVFGGNNGLVKRGKGELQIASPFRSGFTGTIYVNSGELTLGAKSVTSNPYLFLQGNGISINNAKLTLAGDNSIQGGAFGRYSYASLRNLIQLQAIGIDTLNFYQTDNNTAWMRVWPSTDGNLPSSTNSTPFQINGTLTLTASGLVTGTVGVNYNQQNTIVTGSTTLTGNTTLVGYASNGASIYSGAGTHINFNIGGAGHYLYGVKGAYSNGTLTDNGYSLTFLGGGNSTTDGSELCLNSTASTLTGNWIVGDAAGTNAGWFVTNTTTSLTIGTATVNNYSKFALQITASRTKNITYSPSTIYLYGLGPANQTYYPSALDLNNQTSDSVSLVLLPSNIVLNPVGATTLASIGVEVGGAINNLVSYQLNGTVSGTAGLEKTGPGNLVLNAQNSSGYFNTYSGNTQINEGTLTVNYGSNMGTAGLLLSQVSDAFGGSDSNTKAGFSTQLVLNNVSQSVTSIASSWVNTDGETQIITLNGCTFTDNQTTTTTFGNSTTGSSLGYIAGTGTFIKSGTGTLTLTGANTYTGLTQVKGGTLALSHTGGNTLPTTNTVDILGGTLSITTAQTLKNITLSTGILNITSGATLTITGSFTLVNGTITGGGTLAYANGTLIYGGSSAQTVNSGNSPVEWPATNAPLNVAFDNNTYTGYTTGGVKLIAGKTIPSGGTATVNGWLDFAGNSISGAGAFTLNGLTSKAYTGNATSGSPYVTNMSSNNGIYPGMVLTGTGIPANTYIIYIDTVLQSKSGTSTLYLNNNATVTGATVALAITTRGGVKVSLPTGLDNAGTGHVQVTGTKTYNSGASYVFNTPTTGTQIYPGFPTTTATSAYSPAWDVKINVGLGNNLTMAATGVGSSIEVADSLVLSTGVWATNTGLITWDNPGMSYLVEPQSTYVNNSTAYTNSFIATCDNTGTPVSVAGPTSPFSGNVGFKIMSVTNVDTYFPVGASFISAYPAYSAFPSPNRMMINNNFGSPEDFTVVVNYGDIGFTYGGSGAYRVNRIWYVKTSASQDVGKATMKLFYTKRDNSVGNWLWPAAGGENEVEAGFNYAQNSMVEKDYSGIGTNFIRLSDDGDVLDFSNAGAYHFNTEVYGVYTIGISKAIDSSTNGVQLFNRFSVVNPTGIVLPVKVIDFHAYQQGNGVQAVWTCLNEVNMDHYEVERSANATDFATLGSVTALNNGKSSINYSFYDRQPLQGNNYYRVKIVGKDGSINYTNTQIVVIGSGLSGINIFPNPVTQHTFILQLSNIPAGKYTLVIYNTLGQKILNQMIDHAGGSASQTVYLPAGTARGEYHVRLLGTVMEVEKKITVE